uniref:Uncharacterized protein n=1 Tax=Anopheles quadriannulatus TaxID=34691 RepID=A0A182X5B0_ANOQN
MRILFQNEPVYGNYEDSGVATSADAHSLVFDEPLTPPPVDGGAGGGAKSKSAPAAGSPLGELEALAKALAQAQGASLVKRAAGEARPKRLRRRTEIAGDKQNRMSNTSTSTIKQHYYPEGGWGWIIVLVGVLVHVLTHGLQTAVGVVILAVGRTYRIESIIVTGEVHT